MLRRSVLGEYQLGAEEAFSNAQAAFSDQDFVTTMSSEEGVITFGRYLKSFMLWWSMVIMGLAYSYFMY